MLNVQDFIIDQTGTSDINAASAISRENRFLNLKVGYNEVDGGFTFKSAQNDQVSILSAQEATENELFGLGLQPTSVNEETDLYGSGFYPNGDEIRANSEQRYGVKVEFDDTTKTFNISSGTTGDESTVKISDATALGKINCLVLRPREQILLKPAALGRHQ